jgi:hypothetical protein
MKKAFSLLELGIVIFIISLLAYIASANYDRDELGEASLQLKEHINYTRHLAMVEDKFDPCEKMYSYQTGSGASGVGNYQLSFWQIRFVKRTNSNPQVIGYSIYSDRDRKGNVDTVSHTEPTLNPYDGKLIHASGDPENGKVSRDSFLNLSYNISDIMFSPSCQPIGYSRAANDIGVLVFGSDGRVYNGVSNSNSYLYTLKEDCNITLIHTTGKSATITIDKRSGVAYKSQ